MKNNTITVRNINKSYSNNHILSDVSLNIERGKICGLIGENGAGKTTLIRVLSGLIKVDSGDISELAPYKISAIVEAPSLHLNLTAYDNLKYQLLLCGMKADAEKIKETLLLVGLSDIDLKKKVKDFSLGMRQRLAIGLAIIDSPELLILDEPINGLDPRGIKEVRNILSKLKDDFKMTILISSHILSELELIADNYVIMSKGLVIKEISKDDLVSSLETRIVLECSPQIEALTLLKESGCQCHLKKDIIEIVKSELNISKIIDLLRESQILINGIYKHHLSFEEYYLKLIEEEET